MFSCTSYVQISTVAPPEIILPGDSAQFLLVNRFVPDNLEFKKENKVDVYKKGIETYIDGLITGFDTNDKIDLIIADTLLASHSAHEPAYTLSARMIQELGVRYDPDYILSIDNYDLYFDQEVEVEEYDDGSKSKIAYYDLVLNTYLTIYSISGAPLDKIKEELRIPHDSRAVVSGLLAVGPSMGQADENVIKISETLGESFIQKFSPSQIMEMRPFYSAKEFNQAYRAFNAGNWEFVEKELITLSSHPDEKMQGKAAYNLSIYYENQGRISEMEYWRKIAESKLKSLPYVTY